MLPLPGFNQCDKHVESITLECVALRGHQAIGFSASSVGGCRKRTPWAATVLVDESGCVRPNLPLDAAANFPISLL
jgi:hypothetical protein